jgi:putative sigma-54 modulation protein
VKLSIHWKDLPASAAALTHLERRLGFALGRFAASLRRVRACLADVNGDRGGDDEICRIQAWSRAGLVQVEGRDRDLYVAIDIATDRVQRALARAIERDAFQDHGRWRGEGLLRRRHGFLAG